MTPAPRIRALGIRDAPAYAVLRRRALELAPEAFASSPEDDPSVTPEGAAERLDPARSEAGIVNLGAFLTDGEGPGAGDALCGIVTVHRERARKLRHKAWIFGVFVAPERRGQGLGRALMEAAVAWARGLEGVELLQLGVTATAAPALALYEAMGFERFGLEPRALKLGDQYHDEIHMQLRLAPALREEQAR